MLTLAAVHTFTANTQIMCSTIKRNVQKVNHLVNIFKLQKNKINEICTNVDITGFMFNNENKNDTQNMDSEN